MKKTTCCIASLAVLTSCSSEDSKHSKTDNPYYKVEKIKTVDGTELDKITISGPPTPPEGYERPIVKSDTVVKTDINQSFKK